jgi:type IV pilus assembly protein PilV
MHMKRTSRAQGFSLIEVMVALIVLSVGLLGIAKMQALSLSSTAIANKRSLAAIEASSLAAAMHVNRGYWTGGDPFNATINVAGATVSVAAGAPTLTASLAAAGPNCLSPAAACSVTDVAAYDLKNWAATLPALLPNETVAINCGAAPVSCTINITWNENAVAINKQEAAAAAGATAAIQNPSYTLYVQP